MQITLQELAELIGGEIVSGQSDAVFTGFQSLANATEADISFFGNEKYAEDFRTTQAGVVLVSSNLSSVYPSTAIITVENPVVASDLVIQRFSIPKPAFRSGVHPSAVLCDNVELDAEKVSVMPNAVLLDNAKIGNGTTIGAGAVIGENVVIGEDCEIGANVSIREGSVLGSRIIIHAGVVVGGDGYGFEFTGDHHKKIEQLGIVRIDDDVEIGANTTIDRARFGETVIGEGTKIDNQVQIGHNVVIGKHCLIVAQVGISGSARIGDYVTLAAQTGVAGHLSIADGVICGGRSGVISSIEEKGGKWFGYPAKPMKESLRESMRIKQLPRMLDRIKALEKKVKDSD